MRTFARKSDITSEAGGRAAASDNCPVDEGDVGCGQRQRRVVPPKDVGITSSITWDGTATSSVVVVLDGPGEGGRDCGRIGSSTSCE